MSEVFTFTAMATSIKPPAQFFLLFILFCTTCATDNILNGKSSEVGIGMGMGTGNQLYLWANEKEDEDDITEARSWVERERKSCDYSDGKWVYDQTYPLYDTNCPYLSTAVTCQKNGRPDSDYQKWRWKPQGCSLSR